MQRANRHVVGLEFFQGYRTPDREEKVIDVALGVDLIAGIAENRFDRVDIVGGDGDHLYPIKLAHEKIGGRLRVHLAPGSAFTPSAKPGSRSPPGRRSNLLAPESLIPGPACLSQWPLPRRPRRHGARQSEQAPSAPLRHRRPRRLFCGRKPPIVDANQIHHVERRSPRESHAGRTAGGERMKFGPLGRRKKLDRGEDLGALVIPVRLFYFVHPPLVGASAPLELALAVMPADPHDLPPLGRVGNQPDHLRVVAVDAEPSGDRPATQRHSKLRARRVARPSVGRAKRRSIAPPGRKSVPMVLAPASDRLGMAERAVPAAGTRAATAARRAAETD